ncbi:MAG: hypothetical protein P8Y63_08735 [Deltaproteobacteria bacterium]|jgi:hypothetical protein
MKSEPTFAKLFRKEAIDHHFHHAGSGGVLTFPVWTRPVLLLSGILVALAVLFMLGTEVEILARASGSIQTGGEEPVQGEEEVRAVAFLRETGGPEVQTGDLVRLELPAYPRIEYGFLSGRVDRIIQEQTPPKPNRGEDSSPSLSLRLEIAVISPNRGPLADCPLRRGMPVRVEVILGKKRLIFYLMGHFAKWFR